jgi:CheY-like chemotaxis protein
MKIFLSSTYRDLIEYRAAGAEALERLGQQGIRMEVFGARPTDATRVCFDEIAEADALVGIYAHRYGHIPDGQTISITEQEFDFARSKLRPVFCFLIDDEHPWPPKHIEGEPSRSALLSFKSRLQSQVVTESFSTPHDFAFKLASSVGRFLLTQKVKETLDQAPNGGKKSSEPGNSQAARRAVRLAHVVAGAWVLLVNDVPEQMNYVVSLMEQLGINVRIETTSDAALASLMSMKFDVVISDMERFGVQDEGIRFLNRVRRLPSAPPVIFTVGAYRPDLGTPTYAFGITNRVDECLNLLFDALERARG